MVTPFFTDLDNFVSTHAPLPQNYAARVKKVLSVMEHNASPALVLYISRADGIQLRDQPSHEASFNSRGLFPDKKLPISHHVTQGEIYLNSDAAGV